MSLIADPNWEETLPNPDGKTPVAVNGSEAVRLVSEGAQLLDVREPEEWNKGHAQPALLLPLRQLPEQALQLLDPKRPIVVVCASGRRSERASNWLREQGYSAANLQGGLPSWILANGEMA